MITKEEAVQVAQAGQLDQQAAVVTNLTEAIKLAAQRGEFSTSIYYPAALTEQYMAVVSAAGYTAQVTEGTDIPGRETDTNVMQISWS